MTGTLLNVGAILIGSALGTLAGGRLPERVQQRVLMGLGLVILVIGIDLALAWGGEGTNAKTPLYVLGGILGGGLIGEWLRLEDRLDGVGRRVQSRVSRPGHHSTVSEGLVTASLLFCVGSLAVIGPIQEGLTGDSTTLATKAILDGFAAVALASTLGWGVALSAVPVLVYQGSVTLGARFFDDVLQGEALAVLISAGGITVIGVALKLLEIRDVKVGNFLPALIVAPGLVGIVSLL